MSNEWVRELFMALMTGMMGWIGMTLQGMRSDLNGKVGKQDCDRDMDRHCSRLNKLEIKVQELNVELAKIAAKSDKA